MNWEIERGLLADGRKLICGVDEAGRGPLAGPVFAAAVILPFGIHISGLNDSKLLSEKMREQLYDEIIEKASGYSIASAGHEEIDRLNILNATYLAMNRAIEGLASAPDLALIDGNRNSGIRCESRFIIGGDGKSVQIAAASILAKVSRDRYMVDLAQKYPQYGFERHKGYGTKQHREMLQIHGPSEIHRLTFLKKIGAGANANLRGKWGEALALDFLLKKKYTAVSTGYRSRHGEIDLIVENSEFLVFVEVKLRKNANFAHAREYVGKAKQEKLRVTAEIWLAEHETQLQPRFDVIEIYAAYEYAPPEIIHIENAF